MRMLIDGEWVEAADGRAAVIQRAADAVQADHAALGLLLARYVVSGGTKMSGNAREALHETLLDMKEQKALLMSGVFPS